MNDIVASSRGSAEWLRQIELVAVRLGRGLQPDELCATLARGLVEEAGADRADVWFQDPETAELRRTVSAEREELSPSAPAVAQPTQMPAPVMRALATGLAMDDDSDPPPASQDRQSGRDSRAAASAYLALPFDLEREPRGVLLVAYPGPIPREARSALRMLARQTSLLIDHARVIEKASIERHVSARRFERLSALTEITHRLLAADELDAVVRVVVESASRLCDAAGAMLQLIDDEQQHLIVLASHGEPEQFFEQFHSSRLTETFYAETAAGQALASRRAVAVGDYASWSTTWDLKPLALSLGVRALVAAPLLVDGAPIGVLWVSDIEPRVFTHEEITLVEALADQASLAIQHTRLRARGEEAVVLEERARLARELHDSVTQTVFSLQLMANAAYAQHEREAPALGRTLSRLRVIAQDSVSELRALLYELRPTAIAEEGLAKALAKLVSAMQVRVETPIGFECTTESRSTGDAEHATFRIVQESLANAAKYARSTAIGVSMAEQDGRLVVTVFDDGVGFDPAAIVGPSTDGGRGGMGLRSMRERAVAAGLTLRIESAPGDGCRVVVEAPVS